MSEKKEIKFVLPNQDYMPEGDSSILQKNIEALGLSDYTLAKLKNVGMEKNIDLARCQMKHFYKIPGMNKKNIFEVLKKMQAVGLDFKRSPVAATIEVETSEGDVAKKEAKPQVQNGGDNKKSKDNKNKDVKPNNFAKDKNKQANNDTLKSEEAASQPTSPQKNDKKNKKFDKNGKKSFENRDKKADNTAVAQKDVQNLVANSNKKLDDKKQNQPKQQAKGNVAKTPQEPKRLKVNSYDLDSILNDNIQPTGKKTLKQEREEKIAKAIKDLPAVKNEDGLYKFYRHGKWGYKTENGKVVIEPTFTEAFNFREGLACVEQNERCGFIDKTGEIVIPIQYDTACSFSEGLASVTKGDKCGYIDKEGNVVFDFTYEAATSFENGIALVKKEGKWGYMDRATGEIRLR